MRYMKVGKTLTVFCVLCILTGCTAGTIKSEQFNSEVSSSLVQGADSLLGDLCIEEHGIFYLSRGTGILRFYDYETGKKQILCDQANCRHTDTKCGAWFGNHDRICGYAFYQGKVYLILHDLNADVLELLSMDIGGRNRKTVALIPCEKDEMILSRINTVYYAENHAWLEIEYNQVIKTGSERTTKRCSQLLAVNLATGEIIELTDIVDEQTRVQFKPIANGYAIYSVDVTPSPPLIEKDYYAQFGEDGDYIKYCDDFYKTAEFQGSVYAYSIQDKSALLLWMGTLQKFYDENGELQLARFPDLYAGIYKDNIIYYPIPENNTENICSYNLNTGEDVCLFKINNGGILGRYMGGAAGNIYQDRYIYYLLFEGVQEGCIIHRYDLDTGEDIELFRDVWNVTFRILSETSDKLIGTMNYGQDVYWIYKTDYEAGNLQAAKKIFTR